MTIDIFCASLFASINEEVFLADINWSRERFDGNSAHLKMMSRLPCESKLNKGIKRCVKWLSLSASARLSRQNFKSIFINFQYLHSKIFKVILWREDFGEIKFREVETRSMGYKPGLCEKLFFFRWLLFTECF